MYCKPNYPGQETTKAPLSCARELNRGFHSAAEYAGRLRRVQSPQCSEDVHVQGGQILSHPWLRSYYNCYF